MKVSPDNNLFLIILTQKRRFAICYEKIIKNDKRFPIQTYLRRKNLTRLHGKDKFVKIISITPLCEFY